VKSLAAFTCAILNNQPMGFYSAAVLVKDAQRHGLRVKPIDVQTSAWACTIEHEPEGMLSLRMGLRYAKFLRRQTSESLVASRKKRGLFRSVEDLALRVPSLERKELTLLAQIGALNKIDGVSHRCDALWQTERAVKVEGPLFKQPGNWLKDDSATSPLRQMNHSERLVADYAGTGLTVDKHPMHRMRPELRGQGVLTAHELRECRDGQFVPLQDASSRDSAQAQQKDLSSFQWRMKLALPM
jgi:error-prone DNA polymerase